MKSVRRGFFRYGGRGQKYITPKIGKKPGNASPTGGESDFDMDKCFKVGFESVRLAANKLIEALKTERTFQTAASRLDLYTSWDNLLEEMLMNDLSKCYPSHVFITKDKANFRHRPALTLTDKPTWFIDPIDGNMNFVHGFPYAATSVAFWLNKQPEFGIIWNPLLDQCYTVRRGMGAYMNVDPLKASKQCELSEALVLHELLTDFTLHAKKLENVDRVTHAAHGLGSTPLNMCMVAQGFADAYYEFGCHAWDMAAAMLMVQESGGVVLDPSLKPFDIMSRRVLCASTQQLAEQLSSVLIQMDPKPRDDESRDADSSEKSDKEQCK